MHIQTGMSSQKEAPVAKSTTESSEIVDEAIRALSGASTKSAADAQRVLETARSGLEQTAALNRKLGTALSTGLEANLKASFVMQTARYGLYPRSPEYLPFSARQSDFFLF